MLKNFSSEDTERITLLLSQERLGPFRERSASDIDAIKLHQAALWLNSALMEVIAPVEISLRNVVHSHLSKTLRTEDWLRNPPEPIVWAESEQRNIEDAERQARREHRARLEGFEDCVPHSQIITRLTLRFWKRLFSEHYRQTLWTPIRGVFPNKACRRETIASHLEILYRGRNRLAHHEFVHGPRLEEIVNAVDYIGENLGPRRPGQAPALAKLLRFSRLKLDQETARFDETNRHLQIPPTGEIRQRGLHPDILE